MTEDETLAGVIRRFCADTAATRREVLSALGLPSSYILPDGNPNEAAARMTLDTFMATIRRRYGARTDRRERRREATSEQPGEVS